MAGMKTTLTAKLKLVTTPDQFRALRATQLAYRDGLNFVSAYAFAHRKTSSVKRLQQATYADLRSQFGLPSETGLQRPTSGGRHPTSDGGPKPSRTPKPVVWATPNAGA